MDRRSFFALVGVAPLAACVVRDPPVAPPDPLAAELDKFRQFVVAEGVDPALDFRPLRQPTR